MRKGVVTYVGQLYVDIYMCTYKYDTGGTRAPGVSPTPLLEHNQHQQTVLSGRLQFSPKTHHLIRVTLLHSNIKHNVQFINGKRTNYVNCNEIFHPNDTMIQNVSNTCLRNYRLHFVLIMKSL